MPVIYKNIKLLAFNLAIHNGFTYQLINRVFMKLSIPDAIVFFVLIAGNRKMIKHVVIDPIKIIARPFTGNECPEK